MRLGPVLALVLAMGLSGQAQAQTAELVGAFHWTDKAHEGFGGFSSIDLTSDGRFMATSDGGYLATGRLIREGGKVSGIALDQFAALKNQRDLPVGRYFHDAEGAAVAPDGTLYVSFEGEHRVWAYPDPTGRAVALPIPAAFRAMQLNSSLEALAIDAAGALYTLPERSGELDRPFPVWRYANGAWEQPFALRREGEFLAVGADFGPDGKLYLLERANVLIAFAARVRRFTLDGNTVVHEETLLETPLGTHGDLEGIAVWRDGDVTMLTMIADDNYKPFMRTEIVEYAVTE